MDDDLSAAVRRRNQVRQAESEKQDRARQVEREFEYSQRRAGTERVERVKRWAVQVVKALETSRSRPTRVIHYETEVLQSYGLLGRKQRWVPQPRRVLAQGWIVAEVSTTGSEYAGDDHSYSVPWVEGLIVTRDAEFAEYSLKVSREQGADLSFKISPASEWISRWYRPLDLAKSAEANQPIVYSGDGTRLNSSRFSWSEIESGLADLAGRATS